MSKWDVLIGLRTDNRKITTSDFDKNYNSLNASLGFKRDFSTNKIFRLNFSNGYRAPNLSELFSDGVHHGTAQYEIGDRNLIEEKNFQTEISITSFGSDSSFGLDVFYNSIQDYIYLEPTGQTMSSMPVYNYTQTDAFLMSIVILSTVLGGVSCDANSFAKSPGWV